MPIAFIAGFMLGVGIYRSLKEKDYV